MPKIKKHTVKFRHDGTTKYAHVDLYYDSYTFLAYIPAEYLDVVKNLSDDERTSQNIKLWKKRNNGSNNDYAIVSGSEEDLKSKLEDVFLFLLSKSIVERKVIIILYRAKNDEYSKNYQGDLLPKTVLELEVKYAIEKSIGENKTYYMNYQSYTWDGRKYGEIQLQELHFWREDKVVLDDTPANREAIEGLHGRLAYLTKQVLSLMSDESKLVQMISSNQKLLSVETNPVKSVEQEEM